MRSLLLLGTVGLILTFGAASAHALPDQAALVVVNQETQSGYAGVQSIEGRATLTNDGDDQAAPVELRWVGQTFGENVVIFVRDVTLLGTTALIFGLGAVCVAARRVSDVTEISLYADRPHSMSH